MVALPVRRGVALVATGVFFLVAAVAQLQGSSPSDGFSKAAIACIVVVATGRALVYVVEHATDKIEEAAEEAPVAASVETELDANIAANRARLVANRARLEQMGLGGTASTPE